MAFSDHPRLTAPSMSVRFAQDTVSVCGSFTTGSNTALSRRRNESRMRHMPLQSTTLSIDACENGSPTQVIFIQHPQRKLYEVHYAKGVGAIRGSDAHKRVVLQLVAQESGRQLWAHSNEGVLIGGSKSHELLATRIVAALQPNLRWAEIERARLTPDSARGPRDRPRRALPGGRAPDRGRESRSRR